MKPKTDASGATVWQDGKPVYVADDGRELVVDVPDLLSKVKQYAGESREKRLENQELLEKLKLFEGVDPKAAREALEMVKSFDGKSKADAEKVRAEVSKSYETKLAEEQRARQALEQSLHRELIGGGVARSKFIAEKSALPADLLLPIVGERLAVENGKVVAKRADGSPIYSRANPGQLADIDEALETLVSESPHRDYILKATQKGGSGAQPGTGGAAGKPVYTRKQFDAMDANQRREAALSGATFTD